VFAGALVKAREGKARVERARRRIEEERQARVRSLDSVRAVVRERGMLVGPPLLGDDAGSTAASGSGVPRAEPHVDAEGVVHWPVFVAFPDVQMVETVRDVSELASVQDIVRIPLAAQPPWARGLFADPDAFSVYYQTFLTPPRDVDHAWRQTWEPQFQSAADAIDRADDSDSSGARDAWRWDLERKYRRTHARAALSRWVRVPPHTPLLFLMVQPDFVAADVPILYVRPTHKPITEDVRTLVVPSLDEIQHAASEE
jgi:hypothetical protein